MARQRHLRNAPIREAIIDIKIAPAVDLVTLEPLFRDLAPAFATQEAVRESTFGFEVDKSGMRSSAVDAGIRGRRLTSADGKNVALMRVDGFTFSRLPPYQTWEQMSSAAKELWDAFRSKSGAQTVVRTSVRYINVMELPLPVRDFSDYLTAPPGVPDKLPQETAGFFTRIVLPCANFQGAAVVTQALETAVAGQAQLILDIDVFRDAREMTWRADDPTVWSTLEQMRVFKNLAFFESITEKMAEKYE